MDSSEKIPSRRGGAMRLIAHLGAIVTVSAWGMSFISTKVLMEEGGFTPVEMFSYRFACAYLLLLLLTCNKRLLSLNWKDEVFYVVRYMCRFALFYNRECGPAAYHGR
jgi:drug/metabolite transporter (DMT)-like permease